MLYHHIIQQESLSVADKPARRCWNPGHGSLKGIESDTIRFLAYGFLLPSYTNFVSFSRYGDILVENRLKTYPILSFGTFLGATPCEFSTSHTLPESKSWGYQMVYISRSRFRSAKHNDGCGRRTDGQTDGHVAVAKIERPRYA